MGDRLQVIESESRLKPMDGMLTLRIIQEHSGTDLLGSRDKFRTAQRLDNVSDADVAEFSKRLDQTRSGDLAVLSFHRGIAGNREKLRLLSEDRTLVTLGGVDAQHRNLALVAMDGVVTEQEKLSLASEDQFDTVVAGDKLHFFNGPDPETVRWAVLNCHDYTHADLIAALLERRTELLVVVTYNNATQLYWDYAIADIHRLFCYVVIVNIAEVGGSGVFVPFRRVGTGENAFFRAAGQIFSTRGPAETAASLPLDIGELRRLRAEYRVKGLSGTKSMGSERYAPMAPSEHFMDTFDRAAATPPVQGVRQINLAWNSDDPLVAVGQLASMSVDSYVASRYRLSQAAGVELFEAKVAAHLEHLEAQLNLRPEDDRRLDFLVLPEVFVPRRFVVSHIEPFAARNGTIVICGVDYPGTEEAENRNSCMVIGPNGLAATYDKITRSQYDAMGATDRMPMHRGDSLYRFVNAAGHAFGILICYDFSHFDLVHRLNCASRDQPLEVLFVVAHNPFGSLYRTCCVADSHRFYQHVVLCNVSQYGGSGVFAPIRSGGARQTLLDIGLNTEVMGLARLKLNAQRESRGVDNDEQLQRGNFMRRPGIFQGRPRAPLDADDGSRSS